MFRLCKKKKNDEDILFLFVRFVYQGGLSRIVGTQSGYIQRYFYVNHYIMFRLLPRQ